MTALRIIDAMRRIIGLIIALLIVILPALGESDSPALLYMGQASLRIVTPENKVIYIDPYAGDAYDLPADLILVTHGHFDHCAVDKVKNRNEDCVVIPLRPLRGGQGEEPE